MEAWKRTVYISFLCTFCTSFGVSQLSPILPLYFHEMGVESAEELSRWAGLATGVTYLFVCRLHFGGGWLISMAERLR